MGMIKGMTGFGAAQLTAGKIKGFVEVKSVNHRYLDCSFYLPTGFGCLENKIQQLISKELKRGRVTIAVKITEKPSQTLRLNEDIISDYLKYSKSLKKMGLEDDLSISKMLQMPGVVDVKEVFVTPQEFWPALEKGLKKAIKDLALMRKQEGKSLAVDVSDKVKRMIIQIKKIQARSAELLKQKKKDLTDEEFSSFQKSIDIDEELTRMMHHLQEVKILLKAVIPTGKKLDFIAQEMQRETNTMGSKFQDKVVTNAVIALKSKIEKIREQAQNIE